MSRVVLCVLAAKIRLCTKWRLISILLLSLVCNPCAVFFFFFKDPAPPEFSPLPLHDALPFPCGGSPRCTCCWSRRPNRRRPPRRPGKSMTGASIHCEPLGTCFVSWCYAYTKKGPCWYGGPQQHRRAARDCLPGSFTSRCQRPDSGCKGCSAPVRQRIRPAGSGPPSCADRSCG